MQFQDTGYAIKKTQHIIHHEMSKKLRTIAMTLPQYSVLKALEDHGPMTGAALAKESFVTPQTMHTLLTSMEKRNLIRRTPEIGNNKSLNISITNSGLRLLADAEHALSGVFKKANRALNSDEHTQLMGLLVKLYDGLSQ